MLSTEEFAKWSDKVVLFLHNTSRVDGEPYPNLLYEMGGIGFPTVSYLDSEGRLLEQVGHITPVEELEASYQKLMDWQRLREQAAAGDAGKQRELFLLELQMGNRPYAEMVERREQFEFDPEQQTAIEQQLVNLQFTEILRQTPRDEQAKGGAQFLAMFRQGRMPTTSTETSYWQYMFAHAAAERDVALFEELLAYIREHKQDDPRLQRYLGRLEQQLEQLKKAVGGGG